MTATALVGGLLVAVPGAAFADDPTPTTGSAVFGDPIPGAALGAVEDPIDADASLNADTPPVAPLPKPQTAELRLEPAPGASDIQTRGDEGSVSAAVAGAWQAVGDSGISLAAAETGGPAGGATTPSGEPEAPPTKEPEEQDAEGGAEQPEQGGTPPEEGTGPDEGTPPEEEEQPEETAAPTPESTTVTVEIVGKKAASKKGLDGVVLTLSSSGPVADGAAPVALLLPEELLAGAYGCDYAGRLQWVQVPADTAAGDVREDAVPVASAATADGVVLTPALAGTPTMVAALAGASSANGTAS